tara:strand:+ start:856 stop:1047 length:192 start_codon:yes stop_codon:yes gene_type:complete
MKDTAYFKAFKRFINEGDSESKGKLEADRIINGLRSGVFKQLTDEELYDFRQRIADAFDMRMN